MKTHAAKSSKSSRSTLSRALEFGLQSLEARSYMAAQPLGVSVVDNVLTVTGSAYNDQILVTQSGNRFTASNGVTRKTYVGNFAGVSIDGKSGNDIITVASVKLDTTLLGG